ncbi:Coenzyme PQQ synthesis protein D [compost metagenome]
MSDLDLHQVPNLRRGLRLQWEPAQGCHVLLYPEGMVRLNESAGEILCQVDGQRSLAQIIFDLSQRFPDAPGLDNDILAFIEVAHAKFWLQLEA